MCNVPCSMCGYGLEFCMINKDLNTSVYCKFSNSVYEFMKRYSDFVGSSVSDFIRQAVAEKIMNLGELNKIEEIKNGKIISR